MLRYKTNIRPLRRANKAKTWQAILSALVAAVLCTFWITVRAWQRLQTSQPPGPTAPGTVNDLLLHAIVQKCMLQQPTTIILSDERRQQVVAFSSQKQVEVQAAAGACPLLHIPLAESDRSIGLCTDAALYVQLLGARIVPDTQYGLEQAQRCGITSAVLFLEPLYEPWVNWLLSFPKVVAVYAPNFEHVFGYDKDAHKRMQLILCKVYRCNELMDAYIEDISSDAILVYTGEACWG